VASYRVLVYDADESASFAVGNLIAEFDNAKHVGYAYYLNDIGEAFWTVNQDDPKVDIRSYEGLAHVFILRNNEVVWRGVLTEHDANNDDVIFYAYGYEHILYHLYTSWGMKWKNKQIGGGSTAVIDRLWARAQSLNYSQLAFASTGTIEAPVTESGGATPITLAVHKLYYKRILHAMKEVTAVATSDTTNVCFMEFDYSTDPTDHSITFNYWKDNTADQEGVRLTKPGNVIDFSDRYVPIFTRNFIYGVGTGARGQLYRVALGQPNGTRGAIAFGSRRESIYLSWVRDIDELTRIVRLRRAKAMREDINIGVRLYPDTLLPARASSSGYEIGDRIRVDVQKGITSIDKLMFVTGEQVLWTGGREYVQPIMEDRGGE
jgi:hypothetical protein